MSKIRFLATDWEVKQPNLQGHWEVYLPRSYDYQNGDYVTHAFFKGNGIGRFQPHSMRGIITRWNPIQDHTHAFFFGLVNHENIIGYSMEIRLMNVNRTNEKYRSMQVQIIASGPRNGMIDYALLEMIKAPSSG